MRHVAQISETKPTPVRSPDQSTQPAIGWTGPRSRVFCRKIPQNTQTPTARDCQDGLPSKRPGRGLPVSGRGSRKRRASCGRRAEEVVWRRKRRRLISVLLSDGLTLKQMRHDETFDCKSLGNRAPDAVTLNMWTMVCGQVKRGASLDMGTPQNQTSGVGY